MSTPFAAKRHSHGQAHDHQEGRRHASDTGEPSHHERTHEDQAHRRADRAAPLGGIIAGTLFDGLDGTLARATDRVTAFGAFFDSSLDRAAEAAIYAGIVYSAAVLGDIHIVTAATLALGVGSLVSYVRARGEGLGVSAHGGIAQRAERAIVLILGLLVAGITAETNYLLYALLIIVALSAVTVVQRIVFVRTALATSRRRA